MNYEGLVEKLASSFGAKRKKQYWQLLKKLYGGTGNAVDRLKKSRDFGIYHSTLEKNIDSILEEGLLKRPGGIDADTYGTGVYFGGSDFGKDGPYEAVFSLKRPSQLEGTSHLYPKTQKAMTHDTGQNPRSMNELLRASQFFGNSGAISKRTGKLTSDAEVLDTFTLPESVHKFNPKNYAPLGNQILFKGRNTKIDPELIQLERGLIPEVLNSRIKDLEYAKNIGVTNDTIEDMLKKIQGKTN